MAELGALKQVLPGSEVAPLNLALVHLALGGDRRAIDRSWRTRAADSQLLGWVGRDAIFDPRRSDPWLVSLPRELHFME